MNESAMCLHAYTLEVGGDESNREIGFGFVSVPCVRSNVSSRSSEGINQVCSV